MNDTTSNISHADWDLTGDVRIVNTSKMNFCLDSTDIYLDRDRRKVLLYQRGAQENQIWKITKIKDNNCYVIRDNYNGILICDKNSNVTTSAFFSEDDRMYQWVIEKTTPKNGVNTADCGEYYIKNRYNGKYLTLRSNDDVALEILQVNDRAQVWLLFKTPDTFNEDESYKYLVSPDLKTNHGMYYLRRLWGIKQDYLDYTITEAGSWHDINECKWQIEFSRGGADYGIKNAGNSLISQRGYAMAYNGDGSYDDQYWFIDLVRTNRSYYIITNRRDGKILKRASENNGKAITDSYTLYSSEKTNDSQYWILEDCK